MIRWRFALASFALFASTAPMGVARAAVDLTGDWYFGIDAQPSGLIQLVQSGTTLTMPGVGATGTIDPDSGAFTLTSPLLSPPSFCGFILNGQADMAGNTFSGSGLVATTSPDCHSIFCACQATIPLIHFGSRSPCGNGVVDGGEACDGGHLGREGDCCQLGCSGPAEPAGTTCLADGSLCTIDTCDAVGTCNHVAGNAGTECRPAFDPCDAAESCDGVAATCPSDAKQPDGTDCSDPWFCNGEETDCQAGVCQSGTAPCALGCDELTDVCLADCPAAPLSCRAAEKSRLLINGTGSEATDKLVWKWIRGEATSQGEFADPMLVTGYSLCLYAGTTQSLVTDYVVPADANEWKAVGSKGYRFDDASAAADGISKLKLLGSAQDTAKVLAKGKGANLPDLPLPLVPPVVVQLVHGQSGLCWGATFSEDQMTRNDEVQLKAKAP